MPLSNFPNELIFYCGACAFLAVTFCCCFHVTELMKLRNLKKFTDPRRYSLAPSETVLFENASRSSSLRRDTTTLIDSTQSRDSPTTKDGEGEESGGNFSIITVLTLSRWAPRDGMDKGLLSSGCEYPFTMTPDLKDSIPSKDKCSISMLRETEDVEGDYANVNENRELVKPPKLITSLLPQAECV